MQVASAFPAASLVTTRDLVPTRVAVAAAVVVEVVAAVVVEVVVGVGH